MQSKKDLHTFKKMSKRKEELGMKEKNIENKKLLFLSRKFSCRYSNRSFLIPLSRCAK